VFNQFTEQFSVLQLAEMVQLVGKELGLDVTIEHLPNPRAEMENHYYNAKHTKLIDLGLSPHYFQDDLIESIFSLVKRHKSRLIPDFLNPRVQWRPSF